MVEKTETQLSEQEREAQRAVEDASVEAAVDPQAAAADASEVEQSLVDLANKPEPEPEPPAKPEDPRDVIARNARAQRKREEEEYRANLNAEEAAAKPKTEAETRTEPAAPAERRFKITVDGEDREVTESELLSAYQKNSAADRRLQEASERLQRAKELEAAALRAPTKSDERVDSDPASPPPTGADRKAAPTTSAEPGDEELMELVEKLQIGSTEEAVQSLKKVMRKAAPQQSSVDINTQVQHFIAAHEDERKSTDATEKFIEKYPVLKNTAVRAGVVALTHEEMVKDLRGIGLTDDYIKANMATADRLVLGHRALRLAGVKGIRAPTQLFEAIEGNDSFKHLAAINRQVKIAPDIKDRELRKEGVQPQPALRSIQARPPGQTQTPKTRSVSEIVAEARRARGQSV